MRDAGTRTICTPRLQLRRFRPGDASAVFSGWAGCPRQTRWLRYPPLEDLREAQAVLRGWCFAYDEEPDFYRWAVTLRGTDEVIGSVSAVLTDGLLEPGYVIAAPYQGKGYAKEALKAVLCYLADAAGARQFIARHHIENPASGAVLAAAGFHRAGADELSAFLTTGREKDCLWYLLSAKDLIRTPVVEFLSCPS